MGIEYRLICQDARPDALHEALTAIARLEGASQSAQRVEFRRLDSDRLPDATVLLEETGMYFCDHGGSGRAYLGQVVALLVSQLGSVLVQEYEQ